MFDNTIFNECLIKYSAKFIERWGTEVEGEKFKWIMINSFKTNWNVNAENFAEMLSQSLKDAGGILDSKRNFPKRMIIKLAEQEPETVRKMFINLYNENLDIFDRIEKFTEESKVICDVYFPGKQHYQRASAVSVYLWLNNPEKYSFYKYTEFKRACDFLKNDYLPKKGDFKNNYSENNKLIRLISEGIKNNPELIGQLRSVLDNECYGDPNYLILSQDVMIFVAKVLYQEGKTNKWLGEDYDSGLSKDDWKKLINNPAIFDEKGLKIVVRMLDNGGEATCSQLAAKYGGEVNFYNSGSRALANRIINNSDCEPYIDSNDAVSYWPVLYTGRYVNKDEDGVFLWKLRDELREALSETDISGVELYEKDIDSSNSKATEWILPYSDKVYNLSGALTKLKRIDWRQPIQLNKAKVGDIIYLYCSSPKSLIAFKGAILEVNKEQLTIDDSEFVLDGSELDSVSRYMEIAVFREYDLAEDLSYKDLARHGLKSKLQGPTRVNPELSAYLHSMDKIQIQSDTFAGSIPNTCLVPFPISVKEYLDEEIIFQTVTDVKLNTILYGPPGTGKTYSTVNYAVAIVENKKLEEIEKEDYKDVIGRYKKYLSDNIIEFTTFHQSYGYEEFIEGIKPIIKGNSDESYGIGNSERKLEYEYAEGVFKALCNRARLSLFSSETDEKYDFNSNSTVWKISLEKSDSSKNNETKRECFENGHIRIGWDEYGEDISNLSDGTSGKIILNAFKNVMQEGDIVLSCRSKSQIDAIGVVTGDYEWCGKRYNDFNRLRKVKWLLKDIEEDIVNINKGKTLTTPTLYRLNIPISEIVGILKKYKESRNKSVKTTNFVMVIDEINRANISKVFGELITLIEPAKREGCLEELKTTLPYSGEEFSVPRNVYVLGTMNTADRSIALIDTALRRRFAFKEMLPDTDVLSENGIEEVIEGEKKLNVITMLNTINNRIAYLYDREHTIGHAFFMGLKDNPSVECLKEIFKDSIIPLLQEYFYEDYSKIQQVLGDNDKEEGYKFILDKPVPKKLFKGKDIEIEQGEVSYVIQDAAFDEIESYIGIYE